MSITSGTSHRQRQMLGSPSARRAHWAAQLWGVGTAVQDLNVVADRVELQPESVFLSQGSTQLELPYKGSAIAWGEKRVLSQPYDTLVGKLVCGGGAVNSLVHAGHLVRQRKLPIRCTLVDLASPSAQLHEALQANGVEFVSACIGNAPENLVVTQRDLPSQRIVLKSPFDWHQLPALNPGWLRRTMQVNCGNHPLSKHDVVLINSAKSIELTRMASDLARKCEAIQISVLTGAIPVAETMELLLDRDSVSLCNLSELAALCREFDVDCPADESEAPSHEVARAAAALFARQTLSRHRRAKGDLIVTLGPRGSVVCDRREQAAWHVTLKPPFAQLVNSSIARRPPAINGCGDRFAGSVALAYQLSPLPRLRTLRAAVRASMDAVRHLAPRLQPTISWFDVRPIAIRPQVAPQGCLA